MNKYNIGDKVWFKFNHFEDVPREGTIYLIEGDEREVNYNINTKYGKTYYNIFEECVFKTKQELLDSL